MTVDEDYLKNLAKSMGVTIESVKVIDTDPFHITPANRRDAEWFMGIWHKLNLQPGQYLHGIHYKIISQHEMFYLPPGVYGGERYQNKEEHDSHLAHAGKMARYLSLIPYDWIKDNRAMPPRIYYYGVDTPVDVTYTTLYTEIEPFEKPAFPHLPILTTLNFEQGDVTQPYMLEVWCEKSNPEPILDPICRRYGVNLVLGLGQMSVTEVDDLCNRIVQAGKPTRIFYISDFDFQGITMGVAVARKLEFFIANRHPDLDVKLYHGMVTPQQVADYNLPRAPMKAGKGADSFEKRYGIGGTELDAMTELKPREFRQIVTDWIKTFYDETLSSKLRQFQDDVSKKLGKRLNELNDRIDEDDSEFHDRIQALRDEWNDSIKLLDAGYQKLEEWREKAQDVWDDIGKHLIDNEPDLDDTELPEAEMPEEEPEALFDTERDFEDQLVKYKEFQRKDIKRKGR